MSIPLEQNGNSVSEMFAAIMESQSRLVKDTTEHTNPSLTMVYELCSVLAQDFLQLKKVVQEQQVTIDTLKADLLKAKFPSTVTKTDSNSTQPTNPATPVRPSPIIVDVPTRNHTTSAHEMDQLSAIREDLDTLRIVARKSNLITWTTNRYPSKTCTSKFANSWRTS